MGLSTDGEISYGVPFEEGYEFPWGDKDIDDWWIYDVLGFKHSFQIYTEDGEYLNGVRPLEADVRRYYDEKEAFAEKMPKLPVELVNYCSGDYPMYLLAIKGTQKTANRGYPTLLKPEDLTVPEEKITAFKEFLTRYELKSDSEIGWYLTSYMG
jgi:hypothetical protein